MTDAYRDPLASIRSRIAVQRATFADLERALTPLRHLLLGKGRREMLVQTRKRVWRDSESVEGLCEIERDGERYETMLRTALTETDFDGARQTGPAPAPPTDGDDASTIAGFDDLREVIATQLGASTVARSGRECLLASIVDRGTPLAFVADPFPRQVGDRVELDHLALCLRAGVPRSASFEIRPRPDSAAYTTRFRAAKSLPALGPYSGLFVGALSVLGLVARSSPKPSPRAASRASFEDLFGVVGADNLAEALIGPRVRDALAELDPVCVLEVPSSRRFPRLLVEGGCLEVSWTRPWRGAETDLCCDLGLDVIGAFFEHVATVRA